MKSILTIAALFISFSAHSLSADSKDLLKKLDHKFHSSWGASYLVDLTLEEYFEKTLSLVLMDERVAGYCFGLKASDLGRFQRDLEHSIDLDKYPVSWRKMSADFSDKIYKESQKILNYDWQVASKASSKFRSEVNGHYFRGCELEWEGSFGGGSSSIFISENGKISIGEISYWSE